MANSTIWFDMDGVLSKYSHQDYLGPNHIYKKPHYFLTRPVNPIMQQLFNKITQSNRFHLQHLGVISKVQPEIPKFIEESSDKKEWLITNIHKSLIKPNDHQYQALFTGHNESKAKKVLSHLNRPLTQYDILIDDYNSNLEDWVAHGGTAIKYGLGDKESWPSYSFTDDLTVEQMLDFLATITVF